MLSIQIDKILQRNPTTKDKYVGCFPSDKIPKITINFPHCFCVNTSRADEEGEHWIAIYVQSPNYVEYFDSFGEWPPKSDDIFTYLQQFPNIKFNKLPLQSERSSVCGKHVIYFLHMRCKEMTFEWIIDHFIMAKTKPDILVSNFLDHIQKDQIKYI